MFVYKSLKYLQVMVYEDRYLRLVGGVMVVVETHKTSKSNFVQIKFVLLTLNW